MALSQGRQSGIQLRRVDSVGADETVRHVDQLSAAELDQLVEDVSCADFDDISTEAELDGRFTAGEVIVFTEYYRVERV